MAVSNRRGNPCGCPPPRLSPIPTDYATDNNALRWDLNGDGAVDDTANQANYTAAFPSAAA